MHPFKKMIYMLRNEREPILYGLYLYHGRGNLEHTLVEVFLNGNTDSPLWVSDQYNTDPDENITVNVPAGSQITVRVFIEDVGMNVQALLDFTSVATLLDEYGNPLPLNLELHGYESITLIKTFIMPSAYVGVKADLIEYIP